MQSDMVEEGERTTHAGRPIPPRGRNQRSRRVLPVRLLFPSLAELRTARDIDGRADLGAKLCMVLGPLKPGHTFCTLSKTDGGSVWHQT